MSKACIYYYFRDREDFLRFDEVTDTSSISASGSKSLNDSFDPTEHFPAPRADFQSDFNYGSTRKHTKFEHQYEGSGNLHQQKSFLLHFTSHGAQTNQNALLGKKNQNIRYKIK